MRPWTIPILLLCVFVAGCVSPGSFVPNRSTLMEVRARAGTPTDIRFDQNGDELWEYARGPSDFETYLIRISGGGKVTEVTQLLTQERLLSVVPGTMTKQNVRNLLGRPSDQSFLRTGEAWSWRFKFGGTQPGYLIVTFNPDNTVRDRFVTVDPSGGDGSKEK